MNKTLILDNLRRAHAVMSAVDAERVDLEFFLRDCGNGCGTHACLAGWLAQDPYFQAQGMHLTARGDRYSAERGHTWTLSPSPTVRPVNESFNWSWLNELFGPDAFDCLFDVYGEGLNDSRLIGEDEMRRYGMTGEWPDNVPSHKELALRRLNLRMQQIEQHGEAA